MWNVNKQEAVQGPYNQHSGITLITIVLPLWERLPHDARNVNGDKVSDISIIEAPLFDS